MIRPFAAISSIVYKSSGLHPRLFSSSLLVPILNALLFFYLQDSLPPFSSKYLSSKYFTNQSNCLVSDKLHDPFPSSLLVPF